MISEALSSDFNEKCAPKLYHTTNNAVFSFLNRNLYNFLGKKLSSQFPRRKDYDFKVSESEKIRGEKEASFEKSRWELEITSCSFCRNRAFDCQTIRIRRTCAEIPVDFGGQR